MDDFLHCVVTIIHVIRARTQNSFVGIFQQENASDNSNLTPHSAWCFISIVSPSHLSFMFPLYLPIRFKSMKAGGITEAPLCVMQYKLQLPKWCEHWAFITSAPAWRNHRRAAALVSNTETISDHLTWHNHHSYITSCLVRAINNYSSWCASHPLMININAKW